MPWKLEVPIVEIQDVALERNQPLYQVSEEELQNAKEEKVVGLAGDKQEWVKV